MVSVSDFCVRGIGFSVSGVVLAWRSAFRFCVSLAYPCVLGLTAFVMDRLGGVCCVFYW